MSGKLFEYVVLYHPRRASKAKDPDAETDGQLTSEIVVPLKQVIAKDEKTVGILASREIPEEHINHLDQVEILVRPFG